MHESQESRMPEQSHKKKEKRKCWSKCSWAEGATNLQRHSPCSESGNRAGQGLEPIIAQVQRKALIIKPPHELRGVTLKKQSIYKQYKWYKQLNVVVEAYVWFEFV